MLNIKTIFVSALLSSCAVVSFAQTSNTAKDTVAASVSSSTSAHKALKTGHKAKKTLTKKHSSKKVHKTKAAKKTSHKSNSAAPGLQAY